jgi:hypothetical protein
MKSDQDIMYQQAQTIRSARERTDSALARVVGEQGTRIEELTDLLNMRDRSYSFTIRQNEQRLADAMAIINELTLELATLRLEREPAPPMSTPKKRAKKHAR